MQIINSSFLTTFLHLAEPPHLIQQEGQSRRDHIMPVAVQFEELRLLVASYFYHAHQVGIFLIAAQQLQLPAASNEQQGGASGRTW
jgi:hypothetical protein